MKDRCDVDARAVPMINAALRLAASASRQREFRQIRAPYPLPENEEKLFQKHLTAYEAARDQWAAYLDQVEGTGPTGDEDDLGKW